MKKPTNLNILKIVDLGIPDEVDQKPDPLNKPIQSKLVPNILFMGWLILVVSNIEALIEGDTLFLEDLERNQDILSAREPAKHKSGKHLKF